ncbi:DUF2335 domain-containing protein [Trinickia acidisoli]|uniref:DUF2335 domain-containing protein n=1 Tax=Trinickia acidisoli TaxID=2767482 RepID=UPI001F5C40EB|nr:DUF2335 domain-containing protein [Trinickia acidisoli]
MENASAPDKLVNREIKVAEPVKPDVADLRVEKPELQQLVEQSVTVALQAESYRGPMPKPEHLRQYDQIVPGAARIILEEFQANSRHSRQMDLLGLKGMISKDARAQWIAGGLVLIGFLLIYQLTMHGHDVVAGVVAGTLLVSVLAGFLTGTIKVGKGEDETDGTDGDTKRQ